MATDLLTRTRGRLDTYFGVSEHGSTMRREVMAGTVTFLAMSYILAVNPSILGDEGALGDKGIPMQAVFTATAVAALFGTLVMGLWARYPIALAPGMGLNAFFAFSVVLGMGIPWQVALSGTFLSGVIFFVLAVTKVREKILNAIPLQLKLAVGAGIGMFVAFLGLKNAGIVTASEATFVKLGDFTAGTTLLALFGLLVTLVFLVKGWHGAVLYGIVLTAALGIVTGLVDLPDGIAALPRGLDETFGQAIIHLPDAFTAQMAVVVLTMLFVDFFDASGTLIGVANQARLLDMDGKLPRAASAFAADSVGTAAGAVIGTSTTTAYVESTAGVSAGGRTGLTAVTTAGWFLLAMFFYPVFAVVAGSPEVTAPALIVVGILMARALGEIDWNRLEYSVPAFITVIMMPLTYSIANGLAMGMIFYPVVMTARGRFKEIHPAMWALLVVFAGYFFFLAE
ncbi:putative MFS transporter, AGZA family, xanthine/uracil permease [Nocardia amikacinitolerans]|uniref:Putative MFS transporter, AGZA family, xanthine/uracil permease n=1 Tax=Nocardia amikacinitolerans TaxID=756689 RepID=A0A285L9F2_9NOCA|nr:NCS2 family permease [Nocardia amikacinitolerans]MCP2280309.1 putative MFS transporter, AGZA family, xanthine/uracil permease [Nocardia amikacinitolerans]MCP2299969.1 putative MFS transporter, AGZA family, xanthine/uracil permease [Nocardia amikacinitolerans]SNY81532.1 putative MFS transporter, AGZA family, xanthine/uracil permease [Nocardia amikacinitolerans]